MLVLSRRETEEIVFPDLDITVRIVKVKGKRISIGIEAPKEVKIARSELPPLNEAAGQEHAPSCNVNPVAATISSARSDRRRKPAARNPIAATNVCSSKGRKRQRSLARVS